MPDVMTDFVHLNDKTQGELLTRYQEVKASAPARELSDDALMELLAINRILRKRASAPTAKKASPRAGATPSLDSL